MKLAGLKRFGSVNRGVSSYRAVLMMTTALLSVGLPMGAASATEIIDGGTTVNAPATWNINDFLIVGSSGTGTLNIGAGSTVDNKDAELGFSSGSSGTVTVSGAGATWTNNGGLYVGYDGAGSLTISNGGQVTDTDGRVGYGVSAGSTGSGTALVTGPGSTWTNTGLLNVGENVNGTLTIENGGTVTSANGGIGGSAHGTVNVDGGGSTWTMSGSLHVGLLSSGTLNITNGGGVTNNGAAVGEFAGGQGTVNVDGGGSSWTVKTNALDIGASGNGTLKITNGGAVTSAAAFIGHDDGGVGNVTVDGGGSTWTANGGISIAPLTGSTGHLTITNGGTVTSHVSEMAIETGSTATVTVSGAGSTWDAGVITIGGEGKATLNVSNGGVLDSGDAFIGFTTGGGTGTVTITGAGSNWSNSAELQMGQGQITVSAGATMYTDKDSRIGMLAGLESKVLITGAGSKWTTGGDILLGGDAVNHGSGSLIITNGGTVDVNGGAGRVLVGTGNGVGSSLIVDSTLNGQVVVNTDGRLGGSGTIGNTTVSGTIAPGNSIGTLNVAGNLTMQAGSTYEVEANAAGQSDKINATGSVTINGGTVKVLAGAGNYAPSTTYTIITANGGYTGHFDNLTSNFAFLTPTLIYDDPFNVSLTLEKNATFASVGITPNQIATGGSLDTLGSGAVYNAVLTLTEPEARAAFDALSGEIHASAKSILIDDSRFPREAAINRLRAAFGGVGASSSPVMAYAADGPVSAAANTDRFAVWGQGFGAWGNWKGDGNAAQLNRTTGGFLIGADGNVTDAWRVGGFAGYSTTSFDVQERRSSGGSDNYHVGLYGGTQWNALAFRSGVAYTFHDLTTSRSIAFTGFSDMTKAKYNAGTAQAFGELGYGFKAGPVALESFANLAYVDLRTDSFTENGGAAALTSANSVIDTAFTTLGLRASSNFMLGTMMTTARGSLGWRHAFGDTVPVATLAFAGGNAFNIAGVPIAQDAAVLDAGLDFHLSSSAVLGLSYGGQFGTHVTDQSVRANFSAKF